jgi:FG-GAP repeat
MQSRRVGMLVFWVCAVTPAWVAGQTIQVNSANPSSAPQGTVNLNVTIGGSGFKPGATSQFFVSGTSDPGGVAVNSTTYVSSTQLNANINVSTTAAITSFDVIVKNTSSSRTGKGTGLFKVLAQGSPVCMLAPLPGPFTLAATLNSNLPNSNVPAYTGSFGVSMRVRHVTLGGKDVLVAVIGSGASGKLEVFFLDPLSGMPLDGTIIGSNSVPQPHITVPIVLSGGNVFGARVMAMGDFDNNGLPDIVVGDWDFGVAFAIVGNVTGGVLSYSDPIALIVTGSSARYGRSVAAGNLDSTAGDEIVVGDSGFGTGGNADPGHVFVWKMNPPSANNAAPSFSIFKTIFAAGWAVGVGDVAGDMNPDLIVGTSSNVLVYPGRDIGTTTPVSVNVAPRQVGAGQLAIGSTSDLVVATTASIANVQVFPGPLPTLGTSATTVMSSQAGFTTGWGTGFDIGDMNGDGVPDVLVGAPNTSPSTACPANVGTAYIFMSTGDATSPGQPTPYRIEAPTPDVDFAAFGYGVAGATGARIFLVGESGRNINGVANAGQVYVYKVN